MTTSIIIPALNEAATITATVDAVRSGMQSEAEVIVVDNGSTDGTSDLAKDAGAQVVDHSGSTVAGVRNAGVAVSRGDCLVFLDADVRVLPGWHDRFEVVRDTLSTSPMLVTGARLQSSGEGGFIERHWFRHLTGTRAAYINSGHLITSRAVFDAISGFDARLQTAEDHDFCVRAQAAGATLVDDPLLVAVHDGYPSSWWGFMRREAWHGGQDVSSVTHFAASKMAWIAALNLLLALLALSLTILGYGWVIPLYVVVMYGLAVALTALKFRQLRLLQWPATGLVFFAYIWGRTLSFLPAFRRRRS